MKLGEWEGCMQAHRGMRTGLRRDAQALTQRETPPAKNSVSATGSLKA